MEILQFSYVLREWGGIQLIFLLRRLGPSVYCLPPKISEVSGITSKIVES